MPKYLYTAKSLRGEEKKGVLEAEDIHQLSKKLREKGFVLVKAKPESEQKEGFNISLPFGKGVSLTEKMFFVRNLQVMTTAGLPLPRAVGALADQTKNKNMKEALLHIREEITRGRSLSEAIGDYPDLFSELFQSMVAVGEESGTLDKVLTTLNSQMEKEHALKSKIKSAMIYPSVIIIAMIGVGVLMLVTVIPKLGDTFQELGVDLPPATKTVIALANFFMTKWPLVIIGLLILIILLPQNLKQEDIKKVVDKATLKIPFVSRMIKSMNSAYMLRTLSSLIAAGTSLPRSLEITSGVLGNFYFKESMTEAAEKVRKGKKLSEVLESYKGVYPLIVIQMVSVGEETGETSGILSKLSDFFEEEVSNTTKDMASIIEPIIMLIIGAAIGFFAVSMIQPMYSMLEAIE
jgi:type IV pilus assembly protein PilC